MTTQNFASKKSADDLANDRLNERAPKTAGEGLASQASELAEEAATKAKQAISDTIETVSEQVKSMLDRQVGSGADTVGRLGGAIKSAAQGLERDAPQLASFVRTAGNRLDGYADDLRGQSADQLMRTASAFTRRQPAMVFGLAALAGFLALRTLKSAAPPSVSSPAGQPTHRGRASGSHGGV